MMTGGRETLSPPGGAAMNRVLWAVGLGVLTVAAAAGRPADTFDLRGPAPAKGQTVLTKSTFKITGAKVKVSAGGNDLELTQTVTATTHEETKVLAVEGRQITKAQTRVLKERMETRTSFGGMDKTETKTLELEGEVIIAERVGEAKWKNVLADTKPTERQKKLLDKRVGPESQDDIYPAGMFAPGHTWAVDAAALKRMFGGSITDLKGKLDLKFVRVEELNGEQCAVIEAAGTVTGTAKEDEGDLAIEIRMKGTTWRSLKTGVDVKDTAAGRMKMSGKVDAGGMAAELVLEGPMTIDQTAELK
jgi:hypothetical protein